jgi:hypothetical protein
VLTRAASAFDSSSAVKVQVQDLVIDAELQHLPTGGAPLLCLGGSFFCPDDVVCMGLGLHDASADERSALQAAGFTFVGTD